MTTFAAIDAHTDTLRVIAITGPDKRHEVIADLGRTTSRRSATAALIAAGWDSAGAWRTSDDGDDIRTVTR